MDQSWLPSIVSTAFSVVVAWYLISKAMPEMQRSFTSSLDNQRDKLIEMMQVQQTKFSADLKEQGQRCSEELGREQEVMERIVSLLNMGSDGVMKTMLGKIDVLTSKLEANLNNDHVTNERLTEIDRLVNEIRGRFKDIKPREPKTP